MKLLASLLLFISPISALFAANEIGYVERFALAKDRTAALQLLVPGTEDYFFYHCLHFQHRDDRAAFKSMFEQWKNHHKGHINQRMQEMLNREAILHYADDPEGSTKHIQRSLNIHFNHRPRTGEARVHGPSKLNPALVTTEAFLKRATEPRFTLDPYEKEGLRLLANHPVLNADARRSVLQHLRLPDYPGLLDLVVADLQYKDSKGFGSMPIHRNLTKEQLDQLVTRLPQLKNDHVLVDERIKRLRPAAHTPVETDHAARAEYLAKVWTLVKDLDPHHNSRKANVLYHRLNLLRKTGNYDQSLFLEYLKLPRPTPYMQPSYLQLPVHRTFHCDLSSDYSSIGFLPPIYNDTELVRDFLLTLLAEIKDPKPLATFLEQKFLNRLVAEAKIVNGMGKPETWASLITPSEFQAIKARVDMDFAPQNETHFASDAPVELHVDIKNVPSLVIKIFEINTFNYYQKNKNGLNLALNLDGLVASVQKEVSYDAAPERRIRRSFKFPELKKRGAYIVEFIGNGKASRALVIKGRLSAHSYDSVAGPVFRVYDETGKPVRKASIWMAQREYPADKNGEIMLPFSTVATEQHLILRDGSFASLTSFTHKEENYQLTAGIHVDRESLIKHRKAPLLIRPHLLINGLPANIKLLEKVKLTISSKTHRGVQSDYQVPDFELFNARESVTEIRVPPHTAELQVTLEGEVKNISRATTEALSATRLFTFNQIDQTLSVVQALLTRDGEDYLLEARGKNGEVYANHPVSIDFKHTLFKSQHQVALQTDEKGRVHLGPLPDIEQIKIRHFDHEPIFKLRENRVELPGVIHGVVGEPIRIPMPLDNPRSSLFQIDHNTYHRDVSDQVRVKDGLLQLDDLPAGEYELQIHPMKFRLLVRISPGQWAEGKIVERHRMLDPSHPNPLHIKKIDVDKDAVHVHLGSTNIFTRVHVVAHRYAPRFDLFGTLKEQHFPHPRVRRLNHPRSFFASGRQIGDEYRYIIERAQHPHFPGNMLERPGLLLNPWQLADTATDAEELELQEMLEELTDRMARESGRALFGRAGGNAAVISGYEQLDFLNRPAAVLPNLVPDKHGVVRIDRKTLNGKPWVQIVAVDHRQAILHELVLPATPISLQETRLVTGLDPAKPFTQQQKVSILKKGDKITIQDASQAKMEQYDSLQRVFQIMQTLSGNSTLNEFEFVPRWPQLDEEEKRAKYSKFACHELHFFLYQKDRVFFDKIIAPYLANKKDKTFMDHWLLKNDLDGYLTSWSFQRLNVVERILLAQRIQETNIPRQVRELSELIKINPEILQQQFNTVVDASGLAPAVFFAEFGFEQAKAKEGKSRISRQKAFGVDGPQAMDENFKANHSFDVAGGARLRFAESDLKELEKKIDKLSSVDSKSSSRRGADAKQSNAAADGTISLAGEIHLYNKRNKFRAQNRALFRKLDKTKEWAENNYYHLAINQQIGSLITAHAFWQDYANQPAGADGFLSDQFTLATRNLSEMLLALAVLDLPFEAPEHDVKTEGASYTLTAKGPVLVFHQQIQPAAPAAKNSPLIINQQLFRWDDRYVTVDGEQQEKFVTGEFLPGVVYGAKIVVTNPTARRRNLNLLIQVPNGAVPVNRALYTENRPTQIEPYATQTIEYPFYFPDTGTYSHYPANLSENGALVVSAKSAAIKVVDTLSKVDKTSWPWISQLGTTEEVIQFIKGQNMQRFPLSEMAWRMQDKAVFGKIIPLLKSQFVYDATLWSYAVKHRDTDLLNEYLPHTPFATQCGPVISSPVLHLDPVKRHMHQHLEYAPLVNPRAHQVGKEATILNERFRTQYRLFLRTLAYKATLDDTDRLAITYYLALQDRIGEALEWFAAVNAEGTSTSLQYDYMNAYLGMYEKRFDLARTIATRHAEHPVPRWRNKFAQLLQQLNQIDEVIDPKNREQAQEVLAQTEPVLDFKVEDQSIQFSYENVRTATLNFYPMDIELLFSRNPFIQDQSSQFTFIKPVLSREITFPADQKAFRYELPPAFQRANVMVECLSSAAPQRRAFYANDLKLRLIENYGQLQVGEPKVYVKVYARMKNGQVNFFKDGYTDFRGRFDYVSLNTNELENVQRFALLVMSETVGAAIVETAPPKR